MNFKDDKMKKTFYRAVLLILVCFVQACENTTEVTQLKIIHDENLTPTITHNEAIEEPILVYVDDTYVLDVTIEALNGIDAIYLNDELYKKYGNGQLIHDLPIEVVMPDELNYDVNLKVVDEIGLVSDFPTITLTAKGFIPSPYLLMDWKNAHTNVYAFGDPEYLIFPQYDEGSGYVKSLGWTAVPVASDMETSSILVGAAWQGNNEAWPTNIFNYGVESPDGQLSMKITPVVNFMPVLIPLGTSMEEKLVIDVRAKKRKVKVDVFIDAVGTTDFDINLHGEVTFGMSNTAKFHADKPKLGQDTGASANATKTGEWETLTFELDPNNSYARTLYDVDDSEVDMLILNVSPHFNNEGVVLTDATYYFKNLRIEK